MWDVFFRFALEMLRKMHSPVGQPTDCNLSLLCRLFIRYADWKPKTNGKSKTKKKLISFAIFGKNRHTAKHNLYNTFIICILSISRGTYTVAEG